MMTMVVRQTWRLSGGGSTMVRRAALRPSALGERSRRRGAGAHPRPAQGPSAALSPAAAPGRGACRSSGSAGSPTVPGLGAAPADPTPALRPSGAVPCRHRGSVPSPGLAEQPSPRHPPPPAARAHGCAGPPGGTSLLAGGSPITVRLSKSPMVLRRFQAPSPKSWYRSLETRQVTGWKGSLSLFPVRSQVPPGSGGLLLCPHRQSPSRLSQKAVLVSCCSQLYLHPSIPAKDSKERVLGSLWELTTEWWQ